MFTFLLISIKRSKLEAPSLEFLFSKNRAKAMLRHSRCNIIIKVWTEYIYWNWNSKYKKNTRKSRYAHFVVDKFSKQVVSERNRAYGNSRRRAKNEWTNTTNKHKFLWRLNRIVNQLKIIMYDVQLSQTNDQPVALIFSIYFPFSQTNKRSERASERPRTRTYTQFVYVFIRVW